MDLKRLINQLHPLERKVLPVLSKESSLEGIVKESKLKEVEVMRALQWLQNKKLIEIKEELKEVVSLDKNGKHYLKNGLPEKRFLAALKERALKLDDIRKKTDLDKNELNVALGVLQRKAAIFISKELEVKILPNGLKLLKDGFLEEKFLQKEFPVDFNTLVEEEKFAFQELKKRKELVRKDLIKIKSADLTEVGKEVLRQGLVVSGVIDVLTQKILKDGSWKNKKFRGYDVEINVPSIYGGKRHFANQSMDYIKKIWLDLGFKEMTGPLVCTSFWDFDALFQPQDHPARDMQDTFYVKDPSKGKLPAKKLVDYVKKAHEKGVSGSKGWGYVWSEEEAKKNVLRTHTTMLSAKTIAALKKEDLPAKFFSVGPVFRNETLTWKALFEFHQTEGIVVGEDVNFRHLIGYLKEFFKKMGFEKIRVRPAYFPYTEPSVEIDVFHPGKKKWMELGGAGIFRPEVVEPLLGKPVPVLAWGIGIERNIMEYFSLTDIRDIYRNDLKKLKETKFWV